MMAEMVSMVLPATRILPIQPSQEAICFGFDDLLSPDNDGVVEKAFQDFEFVGTQAQDTQDMPVITTEAVMLTDKAVLNIPPEDEGILSLAFNFAQNIQVESEQQSKPLQQVAAAGGDIVAQSKPVSQNERGILAINQQASDNQIQDITRESNVESSTKIAMIETPEPYAGFKTIPAQFPAPNIPGITASQEGQAATHEPNKGGQVSRHPVRLDMVKSDQWIGQLSREITHLNKSEERVSFQMTPVHLGRLAVDISKNSIGEVVRFETETEAARAIIAQAHGRIEQELRKAGINTANLDTVFANTEQREDTPHQRSGAGAHIVQFNSISSSKQLSENPQLHSRPLAQSALADRFA